MMKPQLLFGAITAIVGSFGIFDVAMQFAGFPSPNYSAHTLVAHAYDYAFTRFQFGYSSAISVILFAITFILGRICLRIFRTND
jgi:multiple sugar transport system permease protein